MLNSSVRVRGGLLGLVAILVGGVCLPGVASAHRAPAADYLAYVTNPNSSSVAVIDSATRTIVARVELGLRPHSLEASPDGKRMYVADEHSHAISVIDTASDETTATIRLDIGPRALAVSPDGRNLYVAGGHQVAVVDTTTDAVVKTIEIDRSALDLTFSPDSHRVYVAGGPLLQYQPLDVVGSTLQHSRLESPASVPGPGRVPLFRSAIRSREFFGSQHGSITTIDVADNSVVRATLMDDGANKVAAPTATKAYVVTSAHHGIKIVDTVTGRITGEIAGDYRGSSLIALSPDRARAYVAGGRQLEVIDTASDRILWTVHLGGPAKSLASSPDGRELYVILSGSDQVSVLDTATDRALGEIPAGRSPDAVAFSPLAAPRVVTEPTNQSLVYGSEARLYAQATGDPTPAVRWQVTRDGGGSWHDVAGATSPRHRFVPSVAQTGDEYRAEFTNHGGSATSRAATLTVVRAVPTLEWQVPTPIDHGTSLSPDVLDAEASVPGTFEYTPLAGTVLAVGARQKLSVTFIPQAGENYMNVSTSVPIDVTTTPEPPQPPPPPPPPAPAIPTPEPAGPTNPAAPKVCAVNSRFAITVPSRLRPRAAQIASAVILNARGHPVRRASHRGWRVTVSLRGLSGDSYSLRILVRGTTTQTGANGPLPASRTLRADISGCRQSGSIRLIAKGR